MSAPSPIAETSKIEFCSGVQLDQCTDIDGFFQAEKAQHYIKWFNATLANRDLWAGVSLVDTPQNDIGFHCFWNRIKQIFGGTINLVQFVSLMSILSNEVRGNFTPQDERMGMPGHPDLAYLFDKIEGLKRSYNTLHGNKTAFECFNDSEYTDAHGTLSGADTFAHTTDARWSGEVWPADVSTSRDPAVNGFILEADFMKFRGRGFIQTTGRANYIPLIEFVLGYDGDNGTMTFFKRRWTGKSSDQIASQSTNSDWDTLFGQTDLIIAAEAVSLHNKASGNYLALSTDPAVLTGADPGSLFHMGLCISGGQAYADKFRGRVGAVLAAI
jgi:hypothetical protein